MLKQWIPAVATTVLLAWSTSYGLAQHQPDQKTEGPQEQTQDAQTPTTRPALPRCPVMGEPVDFSVRMLSDDGPVYFCCEMCIPKFKKDPQKYVEQVDTQRSVLAKLDRVQVNCPVDDKVVDGKITARVGGQTIAFCSKECQAKYEKNPADFKARLAGSYTYQTLCPVSGEKIQPNTFTDLPTGQRVYFCCPSCSAKLLKDPAKYAPKLAEQGITIDPEKVAGGADKTESNEHDEHKQP